MALQVVNTKFRCFCCYACNLMFLLAIYDCLLVKKFLLCNLSEDFVAGVKRNDTLVLSASICHSCKVPPKHAHVYAHSHIRMLVVVCTHGQGNKQKNFIRRRQKSTERHARKLRFPSALSVFQRGKHLSLISLQENILLGIFEEYFFTIYYFLVSVTYLTLKNKRYIIDAASAQFNVEKSKTSKNYFRKVLIH